MSRDDQDEVVIEQLEEGEISDHSDIDYTPLERPDNYSNLKNDTRFSSISIVQDSDSEDQKSSELDSDSDSAGPRSRKTKKLKLKVKPPPQKRPINNRFNIWSTRVQEDVLSETLNSCDVTKKDRSRSVESYDYVASARYQNMMNGGSYKRTREDRKNIHLRLRNCSYNLEQKPLKGKTRNILDLVTTLENSVEEIAEDISNKLYEEKEDLILKILNIIGKQKCLEIFQETQNIEANGGMLIMVGLFNFHYASLFIENHVFQNQTRRRTPGGVFLYLVRCREDITREEKHKIFHDERKISRNDLKERRKMKIEKLRKQTGNIKIKSIKLELWNKKYKVIHHIFNAIYLLS
ncbi:hypothetical protein HHI36_001203 [Cryptolaemus montrouzieri]|uniref:Phosphorylated adapter RNA export protein n=1 Tax=Cryptolaemus montrouzieri TaxID=559131 RepID=A0ABD2P6W4_9CUCU